VSLRQRFSSVVGPNGSGKSNVIDAMLFVFGKRAAQMRLKKLPELIHKSDAYPDLEQAEVAVHFQEIIDYLVQHQKTCLRHHFLMASLDCFLTSCHIFDGCEFSG
jgi:chromosome segregation ATPase